MEYECDRIKVDLTVQISLPRYYEGMTVDRDAALQAAMEWVDNVLIQGNSEAPYGDDHDVMVYQNWGRDGEDCKEIEGRVEAVVPARVGTRFKLNRKGGG